MIKFRCTACDHKLGVPEAHSGKRIRCPKCQTIVNVPDIAATSRDRDEASMRVAMYDLAAEEQTAPPALTDLAAMSARHRVSSQSSRTSATSRHPAVSPGIDLASMLKKVLTFACLIILVCCGLLYFRAGIMRAMSSGTGHASEAAGSPPQVNSSLNAELEEYAKRFVQAHATGVENARVFLENAQGGAGKRRQFKATVVRVNAQSTSSSSKYDATGLIEYRVDYFNDGSETKETKMGRLATTQKWEVFHEIDPAVVRYVADAEPFARAARAMLVVRQSDAGLPLHQTALLALIEARDAAPSGPDAASLFKSNINKAVESYKSGLDDWLRWVKVPDSPEGSTFAATLKKDALDALSKGDERLKSALKEWEFLASSSKDQ